MIGLLWRLRTTIRDYLRAYMPSNIMLDLLSNRRALKWGLPAGMLLAPGYLLIASFITALLAGGGPGWLNVLVLISIWDSLKFVALGVVSPVLLATARLRESRAE